MLHKFTNRYREIRSGGLLRECASMFYPFNIKTLQQVSLVLLKMRRQRMIFRSDVGFFYFATSLSVFGSVLFGHFQRARHTDIYDSCQTWQDNDPSGKVSGLHLCSRNAPPDSDLSPPPFLGRDALTNAHNRSRLPEVFISLSQCRLRSKKNIICLKCKTYFSILPNVFVQMSTIGQGLSQWIGAGLRSKEKLDESYGERAARECICLNCKIYFFVLLNVFVLIAKYISLCC